MSLLKDLIRMSFSFTMIVDILLGQIRYSAVCRVSLRALRM